MRTLRVGRQALLVELEDPAQVATAYRILRDLADDLGAVEVVPAACTVLLDGLADVDAAAMVVDGLSAGSEDAPAPGPLVEVPTVYDGPDLDEVARQWDVTTVEVVRLHTATEFVVQFCGFAPGFAYCAGLNRGVSRRPEPRPRVAAGSVALAGGFTGVYPTASPGGWQLIGTTTARLWRPDDVQPALLVPGTRVVFVDD